MDTGEGRLVILNGIKEQDVLFNALKEEQKKQEIEAQYPMHQGWFHVGEEIDIRGSLFRIVSVDPKGMRLKVLKRARPA